MTNAREAIPPLPRVRAVSILAVVLPLVWIWFREAGQMQKYGLLHFYLAPIYTVYIFCLAYSILIVLQLRKVPFASWIVLPRAWIALTLLIVSASLAVPLFRPEYTTYIRDRDERRSQELQRVQVPKDMSKAWSDIRTRGIAAFEEPLAYAQGIVLLNYIRETSLSAREAKLASEHYRTDVSILTALAKKKELTSEAFDIIYSNALQLRAGNEYSPASEIFGNIGANPSAPVPLLVKMIESDGPDIQRAASVNPNLPRSYKIAYLKRAWNSTSPAERGRVAADPDTPPDILAKIVPDAATEVPLARNPNTPSSVLQALSHSNDPWVRKTAQENLEKRQR